MHWPWAAKRWSEIPPRVKFLLLLCKMSYKLLVIFLLQGAFSRISWNTKLKIKQLATCPQQILANWKHTNWRASQLLWSFFEGFGIPWFIWKFKFDQCQIFLTWSFNSFSWDQLVSLQYRDVLTVIVLYKTQEKSWYCTNFILFSGSRNIGRFMKAYICIDQSRFFIFY